MEERIVVSRKIESEQMVIEGFGQKFSEGLDAAQIRHEPLCHLLAVLKGGTLCAPQRPERPVPGVRVLRGKKGLLPAADLVDPVFVLLK